MCSNNPTQEDSQVSLRGDPAAQGMRTWQTSSIGLEDNASEHSSNRVLTRDQSSSMLKALAGPRQASNVMSPQHAVNDSTRLHEAAAQQPESMYARVATEGSSSRAKPSLDNQRPFRPIASDQKVKDNGAQYIDFNGKGTFGLNTVSSSPSVNNQHNTKSHHQAYIANTDFATVPSEPAVNLKYQYRASTVDPQELFGSSEEDTKSREYKRPALKPTPIYQSGLKAKIPKKSNLHQTEPGKTDTSKTSSKNLHNRKRSSISDTKTDKSRDDVRLQTTSGKGKSRVFKSEANHPEQHSKAVVFGTEHQPKEVGRTSDHWRQTGSSVLTPEEKDRREILLRNLKLLEKEIAQLRLKDRMSEQEEQYLHEVYSRLSEVKGRLSLLEPSTDREKKSLARDSIDLTLKYRNMNQAEPFNPEAMSYGVDKTSSLHDPFSKQYYSTQVQQDKSRVLFQTQDPKLKTLSVYEDMLERQKTEAKRRARKPDQFGNNESAFSEITEQLEEEARCSFSTSNHNDKAYEH